MKIKRSAKIYLITVMMATIVLLGVMWDAGEIKIKEAEAATKKEIIDLRIIGTTDLHGQLNSKDYEQGVDYSNGGLARLFDLIQTTRSELPKANTITVDAGDTLFDYTTEYIFSENQEVIQPIYKALAKIGYDAITLGNHDFDYGYEYIQRQLNGSGLRDITIVSNVTDSKTGDFPFLENMLITRKVKSSAGNMVEVKIGIIGQTIPVLTSKTHSYVGILKTEDMVANAQIQATKLKEMGADIVIALSHTGIGPEAPELNFKNVAYALTKIEEIDVVVCGHEHNLFPTSDMNSAYYKLPNVDKKTYLMNGKNVIMAGNRGSAVGVVDLTLEVYEDTYEITDRSSEIRLVTESNTKENTEIANSYGTWEDKLLKYSTDVIAKLEKGIIIQNFYGMLGENTSIQLLNDSKIDYAQRFVNTTGGKYKDYPIVAGSTYAAYGTGSVDDFINIHDSITESDLSAIQPYNNYIYIYTVTGKQLKQWLEWSASAYETTSSKTKWNVSTMSQLMQETGLKSLIREEWLNDWSNFFIFDGIDYVINPFYEPRYDINGNKISTSSRVSNVTYNGVPLADDTVMLLVTNKITQPRNANSGIEKQVALSGFIRTQSILSKYIRQIAANGDLMPQLDYNWRVSMSEDNSFIVKAPNYADSFVKKTPWFKEYLKEIEKYRYYVASYKEAKSDTIGPHIIATPVITSATASAYNVAVNVTDASEIKSIKYMVGEFDVDYDGWVVGRKLDNNKTFRVTANGTYSIYSEDKAGNKSIYKLVIDNFSDNLLSTPTIITYTNRKTKISGSGEPNAKIVFEAYTGTYEGKVGANGAISYALPAQPSGSEVNVYLKDSVKGIESARVRVPVKRTGPNQPSSNQINNASDQFTGDLNDDDAVIIAIIDETVYVPKKGGKALYALNTEIYDPSLSVVETHFEKDNLGYFVMNLPPQESGKTITLYNLDHLSRNSRSYTTTIAEMAPNAPVVYEISNIERTITGYVPSANKSYNITITIGKKDYSLQTDKSGEFSYEFEEQLHAGQVIKVTASDTKNGKLRNSYSTKVLVQDIENYVKENSTILTLDRVTENAYIVSGNYLENEMIYLALTNGEGDSFKSDLNLIEADEDGRFEYQIDGKLKEGTKIYAMARFTDGRILLANSTEVIPGKPDMPILLKDVTNAVKTVQVVAKKGSKVTLLIGSKAYTSSSYVNDKENDRSIYTIVTDRGVSGTVIQVTATNLAGTSDVLTSMIMKAAPDRPKVDAVKAGAKVITGKVELLDYTAPLEIDTKVTDEKGTKQKTEETQKIFKNAPAKVAKTQTRIFAQIGTKTYEGTIDKKGSFKIEIPAQKKDIVIRVWGSNKAGRGPLIKVVVVK